MHRRLSDLTASRAEALLGDGADLVAEDVARAAEPALGGSHFDVKSHRRADEILLMTPGRAEIDRPDFTA